MHSDKPRYRYDVSLIEKYFSLTPDQKEKFRLLGEIYPEWNAKINLISRKDTENFYLHHVLHSLGIAKFANFRPGARILDAGTGGGFPGIPLAVMFPRAHFHLVDSTGKKIKAVRQIARELDLDNVTAEQVRLENHHLPYDFVVSRAVTRMDRFYDWTAKNIGSENRHALANGILYLKGGDLREELKKFPHAKIIDLNRYFEEDFFDSKKLVYLPVKPSRT